MATPALKLMAFGNRETHSPGAPFLVENTNSVWLVRSGKLDLFLVTVKDGEPCGARQHLLRVEQGQAVFGVGRHFGNMTLLASPAPGTKVLCLSQAEFQEMIRNGEPASEKLLENWINHLTLAVAGHFPVGQFMYLEPGKTIKIPQPTRVVLPRQGLLWAIHRAGNSFFRDAYFLGPERIPLINKQFFPVTRHAWLQSAPDSEIDSVDTREFCRVDREWRGLQQFHTIAMIFLAIKIEKAEEKEQERMQARAAADHNLFHAALLHLSAPIRRIPEMVEGQETCGNAVFLACQAVGKKIGINVKPHPDMLRGLSMADPVSAIARTSGFRVRTIALKGQWWKMDSGPFLAFLEEGRKPVALLPKSRHRYDVYDPSKNKRTPVTQEMASTLNPFAYVLYRPFPVKKLTIMELLKFALPVCLSEILMIVLMGIGAGLMGMFAPAATGIIFDRLIPGSERAELVQMSVFLLVIAIATSMFTFARSFAVLRLEGKLDTAIQSAVWDRLLGLPVSFFRKYSSGDLAQRSLGIATIRQILSGSTLSAIFSGIFSIFSFALLFYYSWSLALVAAGLVLFAFIAITVCGIIQVRLQRKLVHMGGSISSMLLQFINGLAKFRVSGTERRVFAVWAREFSRKKRIAKNARRTQNYLTIFASVFPLICLAVIFYSHQKFLTIPELTKITTGDFAAFFGAFAQFLSSTLLLSAAVVGALGVVPAYERAKPIFHELPEVSEGMANPGRLTGALEVSHVTFRYNESAPAVLRDVSIAVRAGQFVAIVGASGSGKSTLLRLLLGFEKPESGAIYYDGQDLAGVDVQEVRRQMGVVLQTSRPVSGSIFQNIVGSAPLTTENAWEAARLAGIEQDIRQMPMGLHTQISDGGGGISGGQRQRLMIARAIAGRPRILLFDEATSALDNQTQAIVSRSLESLRATRIVIAHRLSTIMNADCIYVMDKGCIAQSGTYQELIGQEGIFSELARRQMI